MLRWKYVAPRLAFLAIMVAAVWWAMNPLLRFGLVLVGQSITGAKVEIATLSTLLSQAEIDLSGVAVADPQSPNQNLATAETATFDINIGQLLRKRLTIDHGRISGLEFHTDRNTDGSLVTGDTPASGPPLGERMSEFGEQWLETAAGSLEEKLKGDLQTVQVSRQLMARWPDEYGRLETKVKSIRDRGRALVQVIEQTKQSPLQSVEHYQRLLQDIDSLRRDTLAARTEFGRLTRLLQEDRLAIERAKAHDVEYVQQHIQLAKLDPEALSNYLLGPEMAPRATQLLQWIQWGRQQLDSGNDASSSPGRGKNVMLPGMLSQPAFLVRQLSLDGLGTASGQPFTFAGSVHGLTNDPELHGEPTTVDIKASGSVSMLIQATLDHTKLSSKDRITIHCPSLRQPKRQLGKSELLSVEVAPGLSQLYIDIDLAGEDLSGFIRFQQPEISLTPDVGRKLGGQRMAQRISSAASNVDDLEAEMRLSGSLRKPVWKLHSNLGREFANGFNDALADELAQRKTELLAKANRQVDAQLRQFQTELVEKQNRLLGELDLGEQELNFLKDQLSSSRVVESISERLMGETGLLRKVFQ